MRHWTYLLALLSLLSACNNAAEHNNTEANATDTTTADDPMITHVEKFTFPGEENETFATTYTVTWVEPKDASAELSSALTDFYNIGMRSYNGEQIGIAAKADSFFAEYAAFKSSVGELQAPTWEHNEVYSITQTTDRVLSLNKLTTLSKAEGRSMANTEYYNFDIKTGLLIPFNRIVPDTLMDSLNTIAEPYFVQQHNVDLSQGWVNAGYLFYSGFKTPSNTIIGKDSITFVYNQYEIAPYSKGIIRFSVPNSAIKPIADDLSDQWLQ